MSDDETGPRSSRRSGRTIKGAKTNNKIQEALQKMKDARNRGVVYRENVEHLVQDVYEEVSEEEYERIRRERREAADFVVDDDGAGYVDDGEDDFLDDYDEGLQDKKKKKDRDRKEKKVKKGTLDMFFSAGSSTKVKDDSEVKLEEDEDLAAILQDLEQDQPLDDYGCGDQRLIAQNVRNPFKRTTSPELLAPRPIKISKLQQPIKTSVTRTPKLPELKTREVQRPATHTPTVSRPPVYDEEEELEVGDGYYDDDDPEPLISPNHKPSMANLHIDPKTTFESPKVAERRPFVQPPSQATFDNFDAQWNDEESKPTVDAEVDVSEEAFTKIQDGKKVLRMFWLDAFEDNLKHPGTVYLFGRVKISPNMSKSCCVVAKNVERQLFFLKRESNRLTGEPVQFPDMHAELTEVLQTKFKIGTFRCKPVKKKFAINEPGVPKEDLVLMVQYEGHFPSVPADLSGNTFTRVFNTTSTAMERILVERELRGPCWIDVVDPIAANPQVSYCDFEYTVDMQRMKSLEDDAKSPISMIEKNQAEPTPHVSLLVWNIISIVNEKTRENEVVMISLVYDAKSSIEKPNTETRNLTSKTFLCKGSLPINLKKEQLAQIIKVVNERQLLSRFLVEIRNLNPDILLGHDMPTHLSTLLARMEKHKIRDWSKLGRLKRTAEISELGKSKFAQWKLTAGRLVLDSRQAAMELVRSKSYDLEDLVAKVLTPICPNMKRIPLDTMQIAKTFNSVNIRGDQELMHLINWSRMEAYFPLRIVAQLNALPLFVQITQIVGGILSRTLMGGRAERNEYLLLHAFHKNGYMAPDKHFPAQHKDKKAVKVSDNHEGEDIAKTNQKKAQYSGGLVLEPKKGLYETYIILLDFNSLYPSIIQEFNVCFTTIEQSLNLDETDLPKFPATNTPEGILPREIRTLVQRRREVKKLMKECKPNSEQYTQYDIRQIGLKLTANSMYGCLGFSASRFYAKTLAAMITSKGREILTHTKELVEKNGYSVVYGDTDSIMVDTCSTDLANAKKVGQEIKKMVNQCYRLLELDIDGIFQRLLLLKKKKYAALVIDLQNENNSTKEMKGLDIVRRDWSDLARDIGESVVNLILSSMGRDELMEEIEKQLAALKSELDAGKVPIAKFEILKQLTRNPQDYKDSKSQPHVSVALRLNESKKFHFRKDDVVKYIVCDDGTTNPATQRAYHRSEVEANEKLAIDVHYYLAQQIHPVISRLCEPIEEMDAVRVAEALGLDPSGYRRRLVERAVYDQAEEETIEAILKQDFNGCEGFCFECPFESCKQWVVIRSAVTGEGLETKFTLEACPKCNTSLANYGGYLQNCLDDALRSHVQKYLKSPYTCDDVTCQYSSELPSRNWTPFGCICTKCNNGLMRKEYSSRKLFDQQCFFKKIFDLAEAIENECTAEVQNSLRSRPNHQQMSKIYNDFKRVAETYLEHNDYNRVDLSFIFAPMVKS